MRHLLSRRVSLAALPAWYIGTAWANPVDLILRPEAALPPPADAPSATRAVTRGPIIRMVAPGPSPADLTGPFWFRLEFAARGGARIQPASLRVKYLRAWEVDLSDRLKPFTTAHALEIREAVVPAGTHHLRVEIEDEDGRKGSALILLRMA